MKQVQKRYIYSAILSSILFILTYAILDFNLIICIILTVITYIGGIFLFKEKDIREFNLNDVNNYYFIASKLVNLANNTNDEYIIKTMNDVGRITDQILVSLEQRPKKVEQVFDFFDYYLDIGYKIIYRYKYLSSKKNKTPGDTDYINKVPLYIKEIHNKFKQQLKNMQESKMIDIKSEIEIFENKINLKNIDLEVGENNAK